MLTPSSCRRRVAVASHASLVVSSPPASILTGVLTAILTARLTPAAPVVVRSSSSLPASILTGVLTAILTHLLGQKRSSEAREVVSAWGAAATVRGTWGPAATVRVPEGLQRL